MLYDCGSCESTALEAYLTHVPTRQIVIEAHGCAFSRMAHEGEHAGKPKPPLVAVDEMHAVMHRLTHAGFRIFAAENNIVWGDGTCVEYSLLHVPLDAKASEVKPAKSRLHTAPTAAKWVGANGAVDAASHEAASTTMQRELASLRAKIANLQAQLCDAAPGVGSSRAVRSVAPAASKRSVIEA